VLSPLLIDTIGGRKMPHKKSVTPATPTKSDNASVATVGASPSAKRSSRGVGRRGARTKDDHSNGEDSDEGGLSEAYEDSEAEQLPPRRTRSSRSPAAKDEQAVQQGGAGTRGTKKVLLSTPDRRSQIAMADEPQRKSPISSPKRKGRLAELIEDPQDDEQGDADEEGEERMASGGEREDDEISLDNDEEESDEEVSYSDDILRLASELSTTPAHVAAVQRLSLALKPGVRWTTDGKTIGSKLTASGLRTSMCSVHGYGIREGMHAIFALPSGVPHSQLRRVNDASITRRALAEDVSLVLCRINRVAMLNDEYQNRESPLGGLLGTDGVSDELQSPALAIATATVYLVQSGEKSVASMSSIREVFETDITIDIPLQLFVSEAYVVARRELPSLARYSAPASEDMLLPATLCDLWKSLVAKGELAFPDKVEDIPPQLLLLPVHARLFYCNSRVLSNRVSITPNHDRATVTSDPIGFKVVPHVVPLLSEWVSDFEELISLITLISEARKNLLDQESVQDVYLMRIPFCPVPSPRDHPQALIGAAQSETSVNNRFDVRMTSLGEYVSNSLLTSSHYSRLLQIAAESTVYSHPFYSKAEFGTQVALLQQSGVVQYQVRRLLQGEFGNGIISSGSSREVAHLDPLSQHGVISLGHTTFQATSSKLLLNPLQLRMLKLSGAISDPIRSADESLIPLIKAVKLPTRAADSHDATGPTASSSARDTVWRVLGGTRVNDESLAAAYRKLVAEGLATRSGESYNHVVPPPERSSDAPLRVSGSQITPHTSSTSSMAGFEIPALNMLHGGRLPVAPGEPLPRREKEFREIYDFVSTAIRAGAAPGSLYISGLPGTGKTATCHQVLRHLEAEVREGKLPPFHCVEVNGTKLADPSAIYSVLWQAISGETIVSKLAERRLDSHFASTARLLKQKPKQPSDRRRGRSVKDPSDGELISDQLPFIVLVVDEIDYLINRNQSVLYNLVDWPSQKGSRLLTIGLSNTFDLPEQLFSKIRSRMGLTRIAFAPYDRHDIYAIVQARLLAAAGQAESLAARVTSQSSRRPDVNSDAFGQTASSRPSNLRLKPHKSHSPGLSLSLPLSQKANPVATSEAVSDPNRQKLTDARGRTSNSLVTLASIRENELAQDERVVHTEFDDVALELCARKVAAVSGDARRALAICKTAVDIALQEYHEKTLVKGASTGSAETITITLNHIDQAVNQLFSSSTSAILKGLSLHEAAVLTALLQLTRAQQKRIAQRAQRFASRRSDLDQADEPREYDDDPLGDLLDDLFQDRSSEKRRRGSNPENDAQSNKIAYASLMTLSVENPPVSFGQLSAKVGVLCRTRGISPVLLNSEILEALRHLAELEIALVLTGASHTSFFAVLRSPQDEIVHVMKDHPTFGPAIQPIVQELEAL